MAEDSDAEKTEPASAKRLEDARKEGDVPRSRELSTFVVLMTAGAGLWLTGAGLVRQLNASMVSGLSLNREQVFDTNVLIMRVASDVGQVMLACLPLALAIMFVAVASPLLIGGLLFTPSGFMPKFSKLNPATGLVNMFSTNALVELGKAIAKTLVIGFVAYLVIKSQKDEVMTLALEPLGSGVAHTISLVGKAFLYIVGGLGIVAAIDAPYQMWHYANKLKMTRQEMIQESKESDGNPQIKAKIRQLQRQMAQRRMMADVPTADVIVTNPTHYAVALKYTDGAGGAPRVVAKGADEVAAKIRELARENNVPLLEAPPLARALHKHTEIGDEIPEALYAAVAEVLAYVFQLRAYKQGGAAHPERPTRLAVPDELDPLNPAAQKNPPDTNNGAAP
ncbi:flagellar biosynthesis protein FlhB [Massilia sp. TWP1-3-3]|uniref:flagellar biosynthesis protein FlhB n=1 Tax=Massilia sp. TWP1-3-3 TaxID=2804573 RepID=UPI003CEEE811